MTAKPRTLLVASHHDPNPLKYTRALLSADAAAFAMSRRALETGICFRDITEQKHARMPLESLVKELRHSNESLEEFVRAASHDLKEPVRKVWMFSDWLKSRLTGQISFPF